MAPISKRELADALAALPLGAQANRLNVAFLLTGERKQLVARMLGIHVTKLSQIAGGRVATPHERKALAKHFGCPEHVLFPLEHQREVA